MKKSENIFLKAIRKSSESALKRDANSTSCTFIYQPKAPAALRRFSKIENDK